MKHEEDSDIMVMVGLGLRWEVYVCKVGNRKS